MIIAIDGPAGTGKSTVAKQVAEQLHIVFLNSGSFYRSITFALLRAGKITNGVTAPQDIACKADDFTAFAETLSLDYDSKTFHFVLNGTDIEHELHSDSVDAYVSAVSAIVPIRHLVNKKMRGIASHLSIVCEGRDMTTVVFPDADYKFYLDASIDVQACRRYNQGCSNLSLEEIKESIKKRDAADRSKAEGALKIASDAVYIDTSDLTIEQVCGIIINKIHI